MRQNKKKTKHNNLILNHCSCKSMKIISLFTVIVDQSKIHNEMKMLIDSMHKITETREKQSFIDALNGMGLRQSECKMRKKFACQLLNVRSPLHQHQNQKKKSNLGTAFVKRSESNEI